MKSKISILSIALLFSIYFVNGQAAGPNPYEGTVTFFTDEGENFTLYLNGQQENTKPMSRVEVEDVVEASLSIRVVFEDATVPPLKKTIFRMGKDCVYMIKKNKKGEYVTSVKSCTGTLGPPQTASASVATTAPIMSAPASSGPITASYADGTITLSNGSYLYVHKSKTSGGWPSPHVIMKQPVGAKVTITYDDNNEKYNTEVPFDYEVKDYNNNNSYFKLTVDQGGPDKTWYVRLQNGTAYVLTIDDNWQ